MGRELKRVPLGHPMDLPGDPVDVPPEGPGYQMWQTVTDTPISPTFETPEELAKWLDMREWGRDKGTPYETWLEFIKGPGQRPTGYLIRPGDDDQDQA
jgi:hypothetical protein